ncbi:MAG: prepilin-type N-terminal cleavage/methylation domain-containing protein [Elusimicrobiaceae bacterium]|nr:prepilin-type N-terminal cleavage/methylation domain-containing protein [Elusimicrobiaceae bacterium]
MKKGFTLIELLVVVLIIGILASIALPQYTKAVEKSRATEAMQLLGNLANAEWIYQMQNGAFTDDLSLLDIQLPGVSATTTSSTSTKNFAIAVVDDGTNHAGPVYAKAHRAEASDPYSIVVRVNVNGTIDRWCVDGDFTAVANPPAADAQNTNLLCRAIANNSSGLLQ